MYDPNINLGTKFQHEQTCRFRDPSHFMSKLTIFSTKCIFSYICRYSLHVNDHKIKSNDICGKYDQILERGKIGLISEQKLFKILAWIPLRGISFPENGIKGARRFSFVGRRYLKGRNLPTKKMSQILAKFTKSNFFFEPKKLIPGKFLKIGYSRKLRV